MNSFVPLNSRALIVRKSSSTKYKLNLEKIEIKNFKNDEVIIKVYYSSLNYKDILLCSGNVGLVRKYPHVPGIDAAGVIVQSNNRKFKIGEKVLVVARPMGVTSFGGLSEYIKVPSQWAEKIPKGLSLKKSMIFGTAGFTAKIAILKLLNKSLKKSSLPVLVSGSTGGVGSMAIYMLSKLGFKVFALTSNLKNTSFLKKIGANEIIHLDEFVLSSNMPLLKKRFAGIIDNLGGKIISVGLKQLVNGGQMISVGNILDENINASILPLILRGVQIAGVNAESTSEIIRKKIWREILKVSNYNDLNLLYKECQLDNVIENIEKIKSNKHFGRIIVKIK